MPLLSSPENAGDLVACISTDAPFYLLHNSYPRTRRLWSLAILIILPILSQAQQVPPPIANAGKDRYITLPVDNVKLTGKGKAYKGEIIEYRWSKLSGPRQYKIDNPSSQKIKIDSLVQGEYQFILMVTDSWKNNGWDTVMVKVSPKINNRFPTANAGPDQTITLPTNSTILNGSGKDPEGSLASLQWYKISGPDSYSINESKNANTKISKLVEGVYEFELIATDSEGSQGRDIVRITVLPEPKTESNKPPVANAGTEQFITLPTNSTTLRGSGRDPEGTKVTFYWTKVSGPSANIASPSQTTTLVNQLEKGVYQFELTVKDSLGAEDKARVIVNVYPAAPPNLAPTADAGSDQTIELPTNSVDLNGSGTDIDGRITSFQWIKISGPPQHRINTPRQSQTTVSNLVEGVYQFELKVTDNEKAIGRDIIIITVKLEDTIPIVNNPPTADAGPDITITMPERSVTLNGGGTDPDSNGLITKFQWTKISGPLPFVIKSPFQAQTEVEKLLPGVYEFELVVTDNQDSIARDRVTITVNEVLPPPASNTAAIIIIAGLGLAALLTPLYFFFWLPPAQKIMVFLMRPEDEILAKALMPDSVKTEGYRVGRANRSNINKMKKEGLAIHILNTTHLLINTPGNTQSYHYKYRKGKPTLKTTKTEPKPGVQMGNLIPVQQLKTAYDFPCFFIITLDAPLLPDYEQKLKGLGIQIIQHVPICSYILFVKDKAQLDKLHSHEFNFIRLINHYSPRDTGVIVRTDHFEQAVQSDDPIILDLVLHREEDSTEVKSLLEKLKIFLIGSYRNRIRIRVPARTALDYNLSANKFIQAIYEYIPPVLHNDLARQLIGIDSADAVKSVITETGDGEIIGVADTGIDRDHPDLKAQIIDVASWGRKETNDTSDPHGHGTHVTGSIVGNGTASGGKIKGMAPGAKVFFQSLLDDNGSLTNFDMQLHELFNQAYQKGARIHNNSWGADAEARYTIDSTMVDEFIYEHPEMLIIISAGNEGIGNTRMEAEKGYVGFESVGSPATTKNGLTVGASRNKRTTGGYASASYGKIWPEKFPDPPTSTELISGDPNSIAAFSSRGRCDDRRMKPDIVAPGTDILSARSSLAPLNKFHGGFANYGDAYAFLNGTSMAAPMVSGAAALVREYYKKKRGCVTPSAALIKATLLNGTRKLTGQSAIHGGDMIPNPNQGYGILDLGLTIPNELNKFQLEFRDSLQDPTVLLTSTGHTYTLKVRTKQVTWIRACLSYTDFPVRSIQNDLDLLMDYEPTKQKWSGNRGINAQEPYRNRDEDSTNNGEVIRIENAQPGLYTLKVIAHNLPKGKQGFALVVTIGDTAATFE